MFAQKNIVQFDQKVNNFENVMKIKSIKRCFFQENNSKNSGGISDTDFAIFYVKWIDQILAKCVNR